MNKGKLIVFEGSCDGVGKSTQCNLLKSRLMDTGYKTFFHHFPSYGEYQGKPVEEYLAGNFGKVEDLSPYFINDLYALDRAITWLTKLKEHYLNGENILLDRYTTSSIIYQSSLIEDIDKKEEFINYVIDFEYNKLGIKEPDLVLFLNVDFDTSLKLRENRKNNDGISNDIYERDIELMKKAYNSSLFVANYLNWAQIDCNNGNNMKSVEEIHEYVYKRVLTKL